MKKNGEEDFGIPMGCHDAAEICEVAGTFILNKISPIMQQRGRAMVDHIEMMVWVYSEICQDLILKGKKTDH